MPQNTGLMQGKRGVILRVDAILFLQDKVLGVRDLD
jgi:hypothetical protein